jgi:uncharacterized membrane protein
MRLSYIIVPIAILLLSAALSAYFYPLLPAEVAYHFEPNGTPDRWLSREMTMFWVLALQLVFVLLGGGIAWGVTKLSTLFGQAGSTKLKPERLVLFTGNFVALPQFIICFAMVDIFSYNSYQIHLMPMWVFLLVVLGLVTISLVMFGVLILSKVRGGQRG